MKSLMELPARGFTGAARVARAVPVLAVLAAAVAVACAGEPRLPPITLAEHTKAWETWKASRTKWLHTPNRAQSYTGLTWIKDGPSTIGADSASDVRLPGRGVPKQVGVLVREGRRVRFEPARGAAITIDSQPAVAGYLRNDSDSGGSSYVLVGSAGFRIIRRVDSIGVRAWDADLVSDSVLSRTLGPLEYFDLQPEWRLPARFVKAERPETLAVPTNSGVAEEYVYVGRVTSRVGGERVSLVAYAGGKPTDLFFSFNDETSGEDTYGFRFLHAALDTVTNIVTLDFNYAYNPECAFSRFTTCPLPPESNQLRAKVAAGEKALKHLAESSGSLAPSASGAGNPRS